MSNNGSANNVNRWFCEWSGDALQRRKKPRPNVPRLQMDDEGSDLLNSHRQSLKYDTRFAASIGQDL
jgi:hypothetical protein